MAKKHKGHYCKICGEYKSNESFSGKGHTQHICKEFMGEMKKGYKKILDLPFGDNEFEIVNADEYTDTFWRIGHFAWYFFVLCLYRSNCVVRFCPIYDMKSVLFSNFIPQSEA